MTPSVKRYEEAVEALVRLNTPPMTDWLLKDKIRGDAERAVESVYPHASRDAIEQAVEALRKRRGVVITYGQAADYLLQHFGVTPTEREER